MNGSFFCRLHDDKKRLLKEVYDKGARIHHLENLIKISEGRNGGLNDQAEASKARKLAAEKRMHGLESHVAELEEKLSKYRGKADSRLKVRYMLTAL
jgi:chromosome segregation ATPase